VSTQPERAREGHVPPLQRVLFVCIGNACRSQMAEGFARAYGSDVLLPFSAGVSPAPAVPLDTIRAMEEKDIDLSAHRPKGIETFLRTNFDLVVNMSGRELDWNFQAPVRAWKVPDPVMKPYRDHCAIRDKIETLVMDLILELRRAKKRRPA
jgi:arsenate reductase